MKKFHLSVVLICATGSVSASSAFAALNTAPGAYFTNVGFPEDTAGTIGGVSVIDEGQSVSRAFYAAADGIYNPLNNGGGWSNGQISTLVAHELADNTAVEDRFWAAASTGLYEVRFSGGWVTENLVSTHFTKIIDPTDAAERVWGLSGGDVYEVLFSGSWQSNLRVSGDYFALDQAFGTGPERLWLASATGIGQLRPDGGGWAVDPIVALAGIRDISADKNAERVWVAADTGLYEVRWNGSGWVADLRTTDVYDNIEVTQFADGFSNPHIWGQNDTGLYEVEFDAGAGSWNATLEIESLYADFTLADQVSVDTAVWGVIAVPEPASLGLLLSGFLMTLRTRRH